RRFWTDNPDAVIHGFSGVLVDGSFGRIGIAKRHFVALGGYDEEMLPMGSQDLDLIRRAEAYGLDYLRLPYRGPPALSNGARLAPAQHDDFGEKVRYSGMNIRYVDMNRLNRARSDESIRIGRLIANRERKRRPVLINFSSQLEL